MLSIATIFRPKSTRLQGFAYEISKVNFRGYYRPQREGATPSRTHPQQKAPVLGSKHQFPLGSQGSHCSLLYIHLYGQRKGIIRSKYKSKSTSQKYTEWPKK